MIFQLTNKQWGLIEPLLERRTLETRGRKRVSDRKVLNSILHVIQLGGSWRRLPKGKSLPSFQTCHRRYTEWFEDGRLDQILETLAQDMEKRAGISLQSCFLDQAYYAIVNPNVYYMNEAGFDAYEDPRLPWGDKTRLFFESAWTWKALLRSKSSWLVDRLPSDLEERSNLRDLQPYL